MKCSNPFLSGKAAYGCGQCISCRVTRRRMWTNRILFEAESHEFNSFVTLTYDDSHRDRPREGWLHVDSVHARNWIKRLRERVEKPIRYYLVGEYGGRSGRPHYHAVLFGFPSCQIGVRVRGECQCIPCSVVRRTWGFGNVMTGTLGPESAAYIAGYCTKKMTSRDDPRLYGREPEFARMSLRPGIGANAMGPVALAMKRFRLDEVPLGVRRQGRVFPLGRYLRRRTAELLSDGNEARARAYLRSARTCRTCEEELRLVRQVAFNLGRSVSSIYKEVNGGSVGGRYETL